MPAFIDLPGALIEVGDLTVAGWVASTDNAPDIRLTAQGSAIPFVLHDRPDARDAPGLRQFPYVSGVTATFRLDRQPEDGELRLELACDGDVVAKICRVLAKGHEWRQPGQVALREKARKYCLSRLRCPTCGSGERQLRHGSGAIKCSVCSADYKQAGGTINMISSARRELSGVVPTDNVSSNPYTPEALALIGSVQARGGWVLDCGAGSRPERRPNVVNVEVVDYRSTDVLAVGESLPFADNSFDAILSLAVLEHVRDPFACARELMRVLKPGGELLADVPFLQPVHGYPDHYYNMTPSGLANLFAGLGDVVSCRVPLHGHPIFAVQWLLGAYLGGLPAEARAQFAAMTVGQVAAVSPHEFLREAPATLLPAAVQDVIGCLNSIRIKKKQA